MGLNLVQLLAFPSISAPFFTPETFCRKDKLWIEDFVAGFLKWLYHGRRKYLLLTQQPSTPYSSTYRSSGMTQQDTEEPSLVLYHGLIYNVCWIPQRWNYRQTDRQTNRYVLRT